MSAPLPPEQDPAAIEAAMLKLARAAAATGCRTPAQPSKEPDVNPRPTTELGWLIASPVELCLMRAEYALVIHLTRLLGVVEAGKVRARINRRIFEEFDRPALQSASKQ